MLKHRHLFSALQRSENWVFVDAPKGEPCIHFWNLVTDMPLGQLNNSCFPYWAIDNSSVARTSLKKSRTYNIIWIFQPVQLLISAHIWRRQRKQLNPTFNIRILTSFLPIFEACCQQLVDDLKPLVNGERFDALYYTTRCALDMILKSSLDTESFSDEESASLVEHIKR